MTVAQKVRSHIKRMPEGTVFLSTDIPSYSKEQRATIKALGYYVTSESLKKKHGTIVKLADGVYYKEEIGLLGSLPPSYDSLLHALLYSKNKQVGYITGHQLFNNRGLSTQVPSKITVVTSKQAPAQIDLPGIHIEIKHTKNKIKQDDIPAYELEYILNNMASIQDLEKDSLTQTLWGYFDKIVDNAKQFKELYNHLVYKKTKALFGALLEEYQTSTHKNISSYLSLIKLDLSSTSEYKLGQLATIIDNSKQWNIKF